MHWRPLYADAWIGLLQTHRQLTRELESVLETNHDLSLSGLELMMRLSAAPDQRLRLTAVAQQTGLSLSRISRIADVLEARGLVERLACPADARAINAHLTRAGGELTRTAQTTYLAAVQSAFFDALSTDEVEALAGVFARFAPNAAATCTEAAGG
jgi:DNA-binding MarR family transcriptional regulator